MAMPPPVMPEIDFYNDPIPDLHDRLLEMRKNHEGVVPVRAFGSTTWLVIDHDLVDQCFRDYVSFDPHPFYGQYLEPFQGRTLLTLEGAEHHANRMLVQPSFTPGTVRKYVEPLIEPTAHELLDAIDGQDEVNLKEAFCRPFPFRVITKLLGIPVQDEAQLIKWAFEMINGMFEPELAIAANKLFDDFIMPIVEDRRRHPKDDLISQIVQMEIDGQKLDQEAILAFLRTLYPAGGHSTSLNFGSACYCALANPQARTEIMKGEAERWAVTQETLRWEPAFGIMTRFVTADVTIGGCEMKKGQLIFLAISGANNDPKVFPEPRRFDPHRSNHRDIITFGRNVHMCLGRHLASREIEVGLRVLFERFPQMELAPDRPVAFTGTIFRTCEDLWVRPYGASKAKAA